MTEVASRLRRAFTSNANVVVLGSGAGGDVQGLMSSGLKVRAIEQDEKQSQAMVANFRTYEPASQLWKLVPNTIFRGQVDTSAEEGKDEVPPADIKCTKCGHPGSPPLRSATAPVGTSAPPACRGWGRLSARCAMIFSA